MNKKIAAASLTFLAACGSNAEPAGTEDKPRRTKVEVVTDWSEGHGEGYRELLINGRKCIMYYEFYGGSATGSGITCAWGASDIR